MFVHICLHNFASFSKERDQLPNNIEQMNKEMKLQTHNFASFSKKRDQQPNNSFLLSKEQGNEIAEACQKKQGIQLVPACMQTNDTE